MAITNRVQLPILPRAKSTPASNDAGAGAVRVGLVTLGCDKNTVDSERILARLADSGAAVQSGARNADVVILCLTGTPQVEDVLYKKEGLLEAITQGTIVIDCSTAIPSSTVKVAQRNPLRT